MYRSTNVARKPTPLKGSPTMLSRLRERSEAESGFTLIELLVVMIIIAILMAVAVPTFLSQKNTAVKTKATANIKQVVNAIESCATQLPSGGYKDSGAAPLTCTDGPTLQGFEKALVSLTIGAGTPAVGAYQVTPTTDFQGYMVQTAITDSGQTIFFNESHASDGTLWKHCGTTAATAPAVSTNSTEPAATPVGTSKTCKTGKW
jgi:type IV pilus assembly protein PilA